MGKITEETWKIREVQTALDGACPIHGNLCLIDGKCFSCEDKRVMQRLVESGKACATHRRLLHKGKCRKCEITKSRATHEGKHYERDDRYGRGGRVSWLTQLTSVDTSAFIVARERSTLGSLVILDEAEARQALKIVSQVLKKKPDIHHNKTQSGKAMNYRAVLWGVNLENGVEVCNALASAGITEYKITPDHWLTVWIQRDLVVRKLLK